MTLIPYDPFRSMDNMRRDIDRMFFGMPSIFQQNINTPRVDVHETDTEVIAAFDIPGLTNKEDVQIDVFDNVLTVSGKISRMNEVKEEQMHRKERYIGQFQRTVTLPSSVMSEGSKASYKNGVLEVKMPKSQTENKRRINVDFH